MTLEDPDLQRYVMRLGMDYTLKFTAIISEVFDGRLLTALVFGAAAQASVSHHPPRRNDDAVDGVVPDGMRRPVSVAEIADLLGLPRETTRRHVAMLQQEGFLARGAGRSVVVPAAVMKRPEIDWMVRQNHIAVRHLLDGLRQGATEVLAPPAPADRA